MCIVPTLTVKTPINEDTLAEYEFTWYEGNCNDEQTKEQIIQNTIDAINSGANRILGSIFSDSQNIKLNSDHFQVFCGAKVCVTTILKNSKLWFLNVILEDLIRVIMRVAFEIFGFVKLDM